MSKLISIGIVITGVASAINLFLTIINQKKIMSKIDELRSAQAEQREYLANISADVQNLTDKLENLDIPDDVLQDAKDIAESLKAVADRTPDEPVIDPTDPGEEENENPPQPAPEDEA